MRSLTREVQISLLHQAILPANSQDAYRMYKCSITFLHNFHLLCIVLPPKSLLWFRLIISAFSSSLQSVSILERDTSCSSYIYRLVISLCHYRITHSFTPSPIKIIDHHKMILSEQCPLLPTNHSFTLIHHLPFRHNHISTTVCCSFNSICRLFSMFLILWCFFVYLSQDSLCPPPPPLHLCHAFMLFYRSYWSTHADCCQVRQTNWNRLHTWHGLWAHTWTHTLAEVVRL